MSSFRPDRASNRQPARLDWDRTNFGEAIGPFIAAGISLPDLLPLIPHDAQLAEGSKVDWGQRGKIPGRLKSDGKWVGLNGSWPTDGLDDELQNIAGKWPTANVGLRAANYPAVDIDVQSEAARNFVQRIVFEILGEAPVRVRGKSPRVLLPFRLTGDEPIRKMRMVFSFQGQQHAVEVLGLGQQYVVAGIHPSGVAYRWSDGAGTAKAARPNWHSDELSKISVGRIEKFWNVLTDRLERAGAIIENKRASSSERGPLKRVADHEPAFPPEMAVAALRAVPNNERSLPTRESLIAVLASFKAALGYRAENYRDAAHDWAVAEEWADTGYFDKVWDSLTHVHVGPDHLIARARKAGWRGDAKIAFPDDLPASVRPSSEGPLPLFTPLPPSEPYPLQALGVLLSRAALGISRKIQVPVATAAQSVLAVASLAAQPHADVKLPFGQTRPLSLFFATVVHSGGRKTSSDNEALLPVREREKGLKDEHGREYRTWAIAYAAWQAEKRKIEADKKLDFISRQVALTALGPEPLSPLHPFLTVPEPTIEGLVKAWVAAPASLGLFTAEGGQWIGGHGMSPDHRLKTAATFSEIWDGRPIRRVRAGDGVTVLDGRRLALHVMVQPEAAGQFLGDSALRDQGLLSRILVAAPESIAGTRLFRSPSQDDEDAIKKYSARIGSLLEAPWPFTNERRNELAPPSLRMSAKAEARWRAFYDEIERKCGQGGELASIQDFAAKAAEHAARMAGILTIIADRRATEISADTMTDAATLVRWYVQEALRLQQGVRTEPRLIRADGLLGWLKNRHQASVGFREILQFGPALLRTKAAADEAVSILTAHGWLEEISIRPRRFRLVQK